MGRGVREVKGGMEGKVSAASPRLSPAAAGGGGEEGGDGPRRLRAPAAGRGLRNMAGSGGGGAASPVSLGAPRCPSPSGARLLSANCFPFGFVSILPPLPSPFIFVLKVPFGVVTLRS